MSVKQVASFNTTKSGERVDVIRGFTPFVKDELYAHSSDPGIVKTLADKDLNRFHPKKIDGWSAKNGGRYVYTAWVSNNLTGTFWVGGESFPASEYPDYTGPQPPYTAAWRTEYSRPGQEGVAPEDIVTWGGEGIGKRLAIAGLADAVALTVNGGPEGRPPLDRTGNAIATGLYNLKGQALYEHLGNITGDPNDTEPLGYEKIGVFTPEENPGMTDVQKEPRVGMILTPEKQALIVARTAQFVTMYA